MGLCTFLLTTVDREPAEEELPCFWPPGLTCFFSSPGSSPTLFGEAAPSGGWPMHFRWPGSLRGSRGRAKARETYLPLLRFI